MHVVATAGHVDHGKSTLVRALTGIDPDRLTEEKERGLTIDLGFASMPLPSGRSVAFIDVPGHVRFLKNMLAGVSGIDACLFVVAATEGWKPQSEEHLRILELLGLRHGLVALTKAGEADEELLELAHLDVADHTEGTFLADATVVVTDAISGLGVDDLTRTLDRLLADVPTAADHRRPRLWVDRAFPIKGSGTVVTGTLTGGKLRVGETLAVLPGHRTVRVRALQSLYHTHTEIGPGNRVALNLSGVRHRDVGRGDAVVNPHQWHVTTMADAELTVLDSVDHPVSRRGAYVAYIGAGEHAVKMRVLGAAEISPGTTGLVRLYLPQPLPLVAGDRFILRESGRAETVGGGELLDVDPVLSAARARPDRSVERMIAERGRIAVDQLARLTGVMRTPDVGTWAVDSDYLQSTKGRLTTAVAEAEPLGLDLAGLDDFERTLINQMDDLVVDAGRVHPSDAHDLLAEHPFLAAVEASPFSPPPPDGVNLQELRRLVQQGHLVESNGIYFAASAVDEAALIVARMLGEQSAPVTVAEVRDAWSTSRKFALALLAFFDRTGVTRRRGDYRIGGPRLPTQHQ